MGAILIHPKFFKIKFFKIILFHFRRGSVDGRSSANIAICGCRSSPQSSGALFRTRHGRKPQICTGISIAIDKAINRTYTRGKLLPLSSTACTSGFTFIYSSAEVDDMQVKIAGPKNSYLELEFCVYDMCNKN